MQGSRVHLAILATIALFMVAAADAAELPAITTAEWREDLIQVADHLRKHPGVYDHVTPAEFDEAVQSLNEDLPALQPNQVLVRLKQLVALIPDSHTTATSQDRRTEEWPMFPVRIVELDDGAWVLSASKEHADLVGRRVLAIGNTPIAEALTQVATVIPSDSELNLRRIRPREMTAPRVLHGLGLIDTMDTLPITVDHEGTPVTAHVTAVPGSRNSGWYHHGFGLPVDGFVTAYDEAPGPLPVSWAHANEIRGHRDAWWYTWMEDEKTFYLRYNSTKNRDEETLAAFWTRMWEELDRRPVERFIVDIRYNHGGNLFLTKPLIHGLIKRDHINRSGALLVLTGRYTFSAGVAAAVDLATETNALLIGEPPAQRPNFYAEARGVTASNSRFRMEVSQYGWVNTFPWDERDYLAPDIAVSETMDDMRAGRDPALEMALSLEPGGWTPLDEVTRAALDEGNSELARRRYRDHKSRFPDRWSTTNVALNGLGYELLGEERVEDAITVFELNAITYPDDANAWDSLAEACMKHGNHEAAIANYEKSLALNPDNTNAGEMIQQMRHP